MARLAAMRNSGGGEEGDSDAADKKRMKALAKANPAYARSLAQQQSVKAAIAKVTAQEQKVWERENTKKVEATQAYKENENKGQYLKQELRNIRTDEAAYRAEQAEREQAMQSHRQGEKDAVAIAEEYKARVREEANLSHREGERKAIDAVREYANQTYREGEHVVVQPGQEEEKLNQIACTQENTQKPKPWWQSFAFWVGNGFGLAKSVEETTDTSKVIVTTLGDGKVSFSAPRNVRDLFNIHGRRYNPTTLSTSSAAKGAFTSAAKNGTVLFNFGVSTLVNIYEYQFGKHKDKTVFSHEFAVSTLVDTVFSVAVGLAAAGIVAAVVFVLTALGVITAVVTTPALIVVGVITAVLAIGIGFFVDIELELPSQVKDIINQRINETQGENQ